MVCRVTPLVLAASLWGTVSGQLRGETTSIEPPDDSSAATASVAAPTVTLDDVPALIEQLGSPRFADRRRAEEQLLRLGPEAYDLLEQAGDHADPEINERLAYIRLSLRIDWVRPDDPPSVVRVLHFYGGLQEEGRLDCIQQLAALPDGDGIAPLVRIARFDSKDVVAAWAALGVLEMDDDGLRDRGALARALQAEAGAGDRPPLQWLRLRLAGLDDPVAALGQWGEAVDDAAQPLLATHVADDDTHAARVVARLVRHQLRQCDVHGAAADVATALRRIVSLDENLPRQEDRETMVEVLCEHGDRDGNLHGVCAFYFDDDPTGFAGLCYVFAWSARHDRAGAAELLLPDYQELAQKRRGPRYLMAVARRKADQPQAAEDESVAAHEMELEDPFDLEATERRYIADLLAELGCIDWAMREYRGAIDACEFTDYTSVQSRYDLAQWLADDEQYAAAAETLGEFCDAIRDDEQVREKFYEEWPYSGWSPKRYLSTLGGQRYLYAAYAAEAEGDVTTQRACLQEAVELDEQNPDILIALYRLEVDDESAKTKAMERIDRVARGFRRGIRSAEADGAVLASAYNQYAWLISNTEGDYDRALQYSLRSVELAPEESSFQDTLGRCYFAVGELDKAIAAQSAACEMSPHVQVMQRQLEFFRAERAKRRAQENAAN